MKCCPKTQNQWLSQLGLLVGRRAFLRAVHRLYLDPVSRSYYVAEDRLRAPFGGRAASRRVCNFRLLTSLRGPESARHVPGQRRPAHHRGRGPHAAVHGGGLVRRAVQGGDGVPVQLRGHGVRGPPPDMGASTRARSKICGAQLLDPGVLPFFSTSKSLRDENIATIQELAKIGGKSRAALQ